MPEHPSMGALVRYLWNAAAVVHMYWCSFTWGGSLAMKFDVIRNTDLLKRWSKALFHDTLIYQILLEHKMKAEFVPNLIMVNRENTGLLSFYVWMKRQLLNGQLYHPNWQSVLWQGILMSLIPSIAVGALIYALAIGDWTSVAWLGGALLGAQILTVVSMLIGEWMIRILIKRRNEPTAWLSPLTILKLVLAVPLTQIVYASALASIYSIKRVDWRGVSYEVNSPYDVRLIEYRPYAPQASPASGPVASL
jgi:hypothetical protein